MPRASAAPRGRIRPYAVRSVDNALTLLAALRDRPSLAVKEGAELLGVAPSTAHRLLTTLQARGFVAQDPSTRRYGAGPRLLEVALSALARVDVRRVARPYLVALAAEVRETTSLVLAEGDKVRFIDSVEGPEVVRVADRTGDVKPAHLTSGGKVLLAALPEELLLRMYPLEVLPSPTDGSTLRRSALLAELARVRADGYATSFEQSSPGLSAVAVPVTDPHGNVLAAVGVSVPAARLDDRRVAEIADAARRRARRIEEELYGTDRAPT